MTGSAKFKIAGLLLTALLSSLILMAPQTWWDSIVFYVFQSRDLLRTTRLLAGQPIFWGPEMTGGGTLPGPFYYFLLAISQLVSPGWVSAWIWLALLQIASGVIGFFAFRAAGLRTAAYLWLAAFALAPKTALFASYFYNVSYMSAFVIAALACLHAALTHPSAQVTRLATYGLFFFSGLAIQLHFTAVVVPAGFLAAYLLRGRLQLQTTGWKTVATGFLFFLVPLSPYLIWWCARQFGVELGQALDFVGEPQDAPSKMISLAPHMDGHREIGFDFFLWELKMFVPAVFPGLVTACAALRFSRVPRERENAFLNPWPLAWVAALGFFPVAIQLISPQGYRYGLPFYVALLGLSALLFEKLLRAGTRLPLLIFIMTTAAYFACTFAGNLDFEKSVRLIGVEGVALQLGVLLAFAAVIATRALRSRPLAVTATVFFLLFTFAQSPLVLEKLTVRPRPMPNLALWKAIWTRFRAHSNLEYAAAIKRIYFIRHHMEQDPFILFPHGSANAGGADSADGYIVSGYFPGGDVREWLLKQNLQSDIKAALSSGAIRLDLAASSHPRGPIVLPYRVQDARYPKFFHNSGEGYSRTEEDRILDELSEPTGTQRLANGDAVFKWNGCASHHPYCSTGALVHLEARPKGEYMVRIKVVGSPLSQSSPWIHPEWTEAWIAPYVEIECRSRQERFALLSSIGYRRQYGLGLVKTMFPNHSVLAPYEQEFTFKCAQAPDRVTVGRESSEVEQIDRILRLPARALSLSL